MALTFANILLSTVGGGVLLADQIVPLDSGAIVSYSSQDKPAQGSYTSSADGTEIEVTGNRWLAIPFTYTVTPNTVIEFEAEVVNEPEIAAIGLDENLDYSDVKRTFGFSGADSWAGAYNVDQANRYDHTEGGWQSYAVHVGLFYTGDVNYLTIVNDHDGQPRDGVVRYRNIRVFEYFPSGSPRLDLFTSYANQDKPNSGYVEVNVEGGEIGLFGNRWVKLFFPYGVTTETVLEFDFRSTSEGEIHGVGFDDDALFADGYELFQLFGTQNWADAFQVQDSIIYDPLEEWKHYKIPVGLLFQGDIEYLVFTNDHDVADPDSDSFFRNVQIYEQPPDGSIASEFYSGLIGQDRPTRGIVVADAGGGTVELVGNRWIWIPISYELTPETLLEFDFRSDREGEIHGIGLDEDGVWENSMRIFHLYGTQPLPPEMVVADSYVPDAPNWRSYSIPIGQYYTGLMERIYLVNDNDAAGANGHSLFRHIRLREPGVLGDTDADGLPDDWELQYFGDLAMDGAGDPDQDGSNNGTEYLAGNDPTDFFNGVTPVIVISGGDGQSGEAGTPLGMPLQVTVSKPDATPWENAPVSFINVSGGIQTVDGSVSNVTELTVRTSASGEAAAGFVIPGGSRPGSGELMASASTESVTFAYWVAGPNVGPTLAISFPAEGQRYGAGAVVSAAVVPDDPDGSIERLKFFLNGGLDIDLDTSVSQTFGPIDLVGTAPGWNTLVAEVTDDDGASSIAATHFFVEPLVSDEVALGMIGGGILLPIAAGDDVSVAAPLARPAAHAGSVAGFVGNQITVSGAPGWNANRFADGQHAITVLDGALAGAVLYIDASGATTLSVDEAADLSGLAAGDRLRIVPIWTVQRLAVAGEAVELEIDAASPGTHVLIEDAQSIGVNKPALAEYFIDAGGWHEVSDPATVIDAVTLDIPAVLTLRNPAGAPAKIFAPVGDVYDFPIVSYLVSDSGTPSETPLGVIASAPISLNQSGLLGGGIDNSARRATDTVTVTVTSPIGTRVFYIDAGHWQELGGGSGDVGGEEVLLPGATITVHQDAGGPFTSWLQWPRIR